MTTLIIALDCSFVRARDVVAATRHLDCGYKLGLRALLDYRFAARPLIGKNPFMLDLKLFDTPDTVRSVCELLRDQWEPDILTVHPAAAAVASQVCGGKTKVVSVPLLTSEPDPGFDAVRAIFREEAAKQNCDGFVCAPPDVPAALLGCQDSQRDGMVLICPGVRFHGGNHHNHLRTGDPITVAKLGVDFAVVGRPITEAEDPCDAAQRFATALIAPC